MKPSQHLSLNPPGKVNSSSLLNNVSMYNNNMMNESKNVSKSMPPSFSASLPAQPLPFGMQQRNFRGAKSPVFPSEPKARSLSPERKHTFHPRTGRPSPGASSAPLPPPIQEFYAHNNQLSYAAIANDELKKHTRTKFGTDAVRMGLAPLPSTPRRNPPPKMYSSGMKTPEVISNTAYFLGNENIEGGKRRKTHRKRKNRKSRKSRK